jgi:flavin-dependent dehydrogenase
MNQPSPTTQQADVLIIGGGLAGLALGIELAPFCKVVVIERYSYPMHRVCGEYVSLESWPYLEELGVPLGDLGLPIINQLRMSSAGGATMESKLPLGGFGISRYLLDDLLQQRFTALGGILHTNTTVTNVILDADGSFSITTSEGNWQAKLVAGAWGKRSQMDKVVGRNYSETGNAKNFVGVKYHVTANLPTNGIELHTFNGGYAGISKVEGTTESTFCLCYLTKAENLQKHGGIAGMEEAVLHQNKNLKQYLTHFPKLWDKPETIAQITFKPKPLIENGIFTLGDAAGMITPLCGNGMSIALHGAAILAPVLYQILKSPQEKEALTNKYISNWKAAFSLRLSAGRILQNAVLNDSLNSGAFRLLQGLPFLKQPVIRLTHGKPYHSHMPKLG